jgi:hypothetical protein
VGSGTATIWSIVPSRVKALLATLLIAVLAACLWRARRLGRPVLEVPIVPLPGSELVVATGRLLEKNGRFEEAAALMRADACSQIASRLGQAPGTGPATVAQVAAHYSGLPADEVVAALSGPPPRNDLPVGTCSFIAANTRRGAKWSRFKILSLGHRPPRSLPLRSQQEYLRRLKQLRSHPRYRARGAPGMGLRLSVTRSQRWLSVRMQS